MQPFYPPAEFIGEFKWEFVNEHKWWRRAKIRALTPLVFHWGSRGVIWLPPSALGESDGFSVPMIFQYLTLRYLRNVITDGMPAAILHDYFCDHHDATIVIDGVNRKLTQQDRVELFHDALCALENMQCLRQRLLWRGVYVGSLIGRC